MRRRLLLQVLASTAATLRVPIRLRAQSAALAPLHEARLRAIAEIVLPAEIGAQGHDRTVTAFLTWLADYRAGADMDHGYGFTRLRRTGASPGARYAEQLDALEREARAVGPSFVDLPRPHRTAILEAAIAAAKIERLPARPDGGHVATDLLGFYFNSIEANDLCYRAQIGRDTCRTLAGSSNRPSALGNGGR